MSSEVPQSTVPGPALTGGPMPTAPSVLSSQSVQMLCLVSDAGSRRDRDQVLLCETAAAVARSLTDRAVQVIQAGDPAVLTRGSTTLLLHAAVQRLGGESVLVLDARVTQPGGPAEELFGPSPRVVRLGDDLVAAARPALRDLLAPLLGHPARVTDQPINNTQRENAQ